MASSSPQRTPRVTKTRGGFLVGHFVAVLAGGWSMALAQADTASVERGHDLARLLCAKCHVLSASGESPNPDATPFRDLLQKLTLEGIEDELTEGILIGHKPMPQWEFSGQQIYDLSNFIASLGE